jgi:hypothetical protein
MRPDHQLILATAPLHPTEAELKAIDALISQVEDWQALSLLLIDRGTAPLLYRKLPHLKNAALIPAQTQELLRKAYYKTVSRNARIYEEFKGLSAELQAQNIPFITLKGICMSEWLYEDTGLRQMSDIDILVQEKDGHRCLEILKQAGYQTIQDYTVDEFVDMKSQNHFNPLFRNGVMVEIHIRLQNTREIYQQNLKEVWRDAVPVIINGVQTLRLELSDMLIHACLHLDKHFVTSHVQFTSFNDIVNLIREVESQKSKVESQEQRLITVEIEDFWERFEAKCIQYNFADTVFAYLVLVTHYYKAPMPQYLVDKYSLLLTEEVKNRFENFLAGTGNEFIGRGAPQSGTATHILHLKQLKNPFDFLRYVKGVVFPGKEFMIEKYLRQFTMQNAQCIIKEEESQTSTNSTTWAKIKKKLCVMHYQLCIKYWWLWYGCRWAMGLRGLVKMISGK